MSKPSKIALFTVIGIGILALLTYGFLTSRKLDKTKETDVSSNIDQFVYDEAADTIDFDESDELEDLYDGNDVVDEDKDFEVYQEPAGWEDAPAEPEADIEAPIAAQTSVDEADDPVKEAASTEITDKVVTEVEKKDEPEPVLEEPVNTSGNIVVVVGSYSSERNANKKLKSLEDAGFNGSVMQLPGSRLQSVVAGRFQSISEAKQLANKIEKEGLKAIVRELDN